MNSLSFLSDGFPIRFQEEPVAILVHNLLAHFLCITCLMDGSATRSPEGRDLNGMLEYWLYLPSCIISRGDGSIEEESRIARVTILEFPRLV
jgi:hypothetical protein